MSHESRRTWLLALPLALLLGAGAFTAFQSSVGAQSPSVRGASTEEARLLDREVETGVPLRDAAVLVLTERILEEGPLRIEEWRSVNSDAGSRISLRWQSTEAEDGVRAVFEVGDEEVRPRNETAARVAERGVALARGRLLDVLPKTYRPAAPEGESQWRGGSKHACETSFYEENCRTMESFFAETRQSALLSRVFSVIVGDEMARFDQLRQSGTCKWEVEGPIEEPPNPEWADRRIFYRCAETVVRWSYNRSETRAAGVDDAARLVSTVSSIAPDADSVGSTVVELAELDEALRAAMEAAGSAE